MVEIGLGETVHASEKYIAGEQTKVSLKWCFAKW